MSYETHMLAAALGYAYCAHRNQFRKWTGEPYVKHCERVAMMVTEQSADIYTQCAAMLHDTIEDTDVLRVNISAAFGEKVAALVVEITHISKPEDGDRATRKAIDRAHWARASCNAATIKLADIIDNVPNVVEHAPEFARVYLPEQQALVEVLRHGNKSLWERAYKAVEEALEELAKVTPP